MEASSPPPTDQQPHCRSRKKKPDMEEVVFLAKSFLSERSAHAQTPEDDTDMNMLAHLHHSLAEAIIVCRLGIRELRSGHIRPEREEASSAQMDDKHTLC